MRSLGRIPEMGDCFEWHAWRFEVVDMDRFRVDKVLLVPRPEVSVADDDASQLTDETTECA
jgi:CBS domain containing-hemolysin-like protein